MVNCNVHKNRFIFSAVVDPHSNEELGACAASIMDDPEQHGKGLNFNIVSPCFISYLSAFL